MLHICPGTYFPEVNIQIPENPNPKSGIVPGSCSFEEMLSAVADFKAPVFELGGSMQQGMYTPKGKLSIVVPGLGCVH